MGLLSQGSPLSWEETKRHADHVRRHGILQFLHIYHAVKDRHKDVLKWGDEVSARDPRPPWTALSGHPAPPLFREALPATRAPAPAPGPLGCLRPALRPRVPGRLPAPGRRPCPPPGRPGWSGAWGPALSLPAGLCSPVHSFIDSLTWVSSSLNKCGWGTARVPP